MKNIKMLILKYKFILCIINGFYFDSSKCLHVDKDTEIGLK